MTCYVDQRAAQAEQVGHRAGHDHAVFESIAQSRRCLCPIAQDPPLTVRRPTEIEGDLGQILNTYNNLFKVLCKRMQKEHKEFLQEVVVFLEELPQPYSFVLRDVELLDDGTLDGHTIVANLSGLEEGDKKKLLADSLCELVFMITMAVRRVLDADEARPLIARVQDVTSRVRDLVGRSE